MKSARSSFVVIAAAWSMGACSLTSGVSDLQGGVRTDDDAGASERDASTAQNDAGANTPDAGDIDTGELDAGVDANVPPGTGPVCGATRCESDDLCCVDLGGQSAPACADGNNCPKSTLSFECSQPSDCPASNERILCCFSPVDDGTICSRKCDSPASKQLCNPNDAEPCTDGQSCASDITLPGYFSCR